MLTKKDFKIVAGILKDERTAVSSRAEFDRIEGISLAMADYLATKNPEFDRDKFIKACGV